MSTWLLLRGWARETRHWGAFPQQLAAELGARVITADFPGNGRLHRQRSPMSVAAIAEEVRQAVASKEQLYLLGLSLGGMVAVEWTIRHRGEVAGCVLINTSLRPFSPFYERLRPRAYAELVRLAVFERRTQAREAAILRLTSAGAPSATLVSDWTRYAEEEPVSRANVLRQLVAAARNRAPEAPPAVPLLVLASRHDRLVDVRCSIALAERWKAPLAVHERAGHDLALDDPAWIAARVSEWLRRI
ncbi:MAG TPA: alpha/beta hydrolase [Burkholderiales bacterium]|nr:alpha/beta hydrolase [Burkholderiales bacterium]